MTEEFYRLQLILAAQHAFRKLTEDDLEHEQEMQGWMNQLDQDDQAIQDFCDE